MRNAIYTLFFPSAALPRWETLKEGRRGVVPARWGGENKLISLTQPAVTPPQHDINPKPRLSLFKLYESLRWRIGGSSSWEALSARPSCFVSFFRSRIPSLVGYKQEYSNAEEGKASAGPSNIFLQPFHPASLSNCRVACIKLSLLVKRFQHEFARVS